MTDKQALYELKNLVGKVMVNQGQGVQEINDIINKYPSSIKSITSGLLKLAYDVNIIFIIHI
jgi:hypothetical protein